MTAARRSGRVAVVVATLACALALPPSALATGGSLTFVELDMDGASGVDGIDTATSVAVSPDGMHAYVTGGGGNAVATFTRNPTSGGLTFVEVDSDGVSGVDGLMGASSVAVSPDGKHVYVTGAGDGAVATFARDATSGALSFVELDQDGAGGVDGLAGAISVAVAPDGRHVYVTGQADNAVVTFARDAASGALSFVELEQDGSGGVDGLAGAASVTVSSDGKQVFVAGQADGAVATFARDATSGALSFVELDRDGVGGVDGIEGASGVTASLDGKHVYVTGAGDGAVATFARDASSGALTYVELDRDGALGIDGLAGAASVTVSPDGKSVYVAGQADNAVATFARDAMSGALSFVEVDQDGAVGVDGLSGARSVTVSPDSAHAYVAGALDNAVATFAREVPDLTLTVTMSGAGSGTVIGGAISCGPNATGDCSATVAPGSAIGVDGLAGRELDVRHVHRCGLCDESVHRDAGRRHARGRELRRRTTHADGHHRGCGLGNPHRRGDQLRPDTTRAIALRPSWMAPSSS